MVALAHLTAEGFREDRGREAFDLSAGLGQTGFDAVGCQRRFDSPVSWLG
jgi:hypothetical protein